MKVKVIAEAGVNHNGDIEIAHELIKESKKAGADAVKFQTFTADQITTCDAAKADYQINENKEETQHKMLSRLELSEDNHIALKKHCEELGIEFMSTAFGKKELDILIKCGIRTIKVASGEITNKPLLEYMAQMAAKQELSVLISTGMSDLNDIENALGIFIGANISKNDITIMHCTSSYPAPSNELNMKALKLLEEKFNCPIGYSDHSVGIEAAICATSIGASVIEKHITLDKTMVGPDHSASLDPEEFEKMVQSIRKYEDMLGIEKKEVQESEMNTKSVARRSIRASNYIKKGDVLKEDDLVYLRPADGLSPMLYRQVIGKKADKDYKINEAIDSKIFE